jgi:chemotaxis protein methyltransferase CheR
VTASAFNLPDDYTMFCEGVRTLAGIDLLQYKRGQMERRLRTFAGRRGVSGLVDYLSVLKSDSDELDQFLDRVTINVSQLFRNPEQWEIIARTLPELAEAGRVRIWSAGCSYGAEVYTLAAVCLERIPNARVEIRGTDIDLRVLAKAREGLFSAEDARTAPPRTLERYFERTVNGWCAKAELKRMVSFEQGDLLRMRFPAQAYDMVLCRNVVIYFNEPVRDELHGKLAGATRSGGYFIVGATERVSAPAELGLTPTHPFTYRKV